MPARNHILKTLSVVNSRDAGSDRVDCTEALKSGDSTIRVDIGTHLSNGNPPPPTFEENHDQAMEDLKSSEEVKIPKKKFTRTRTGCLTCRGRKKKCDENHPECKLTDVSTGLKFKDIC
jgi:hypothetical protein